MHIIFTILISLSFLHSQPKTKAELVDYQVKEVNNFFESFIQVDNKKIRQELDYFLYSYKSYLESEAVYNALIDSKVDLGKTPAFEVLLKDDRFKEQTITVFNKFKYLVDQLNFLLNSEQKETFRAKISASKIVSKNKLEEKNDRNQKYPYSNFQNIFDPESLRSIEMYSAYKDFIFEYFDYLKKFENIKDLNEDEKALYSRYQLQLDQKNKDLIKAIEFLLSKDRLESLINKIEKQLEVFEKQKADLLKSDINVVLNEYEITSQKRVQDLKSDTQFKRPNYFRAQQIYALMGVDININHLEVLIQEIKSISSNGKLKNILTYLNNYTKVKFMSEKAFNEYKDFVTVNNALLSSSFETIIDAKVRVSTYEKARFITKNFGSSFSSFAVSILATEMFTGLTKGYFLPKNNQKYFKNYTVTQALSSPFINNFNNLENLGAFAIPLITFSGSATSTVMALTPLLNYTEKYASNFLVRTMLGQLNSAAIFGATMTIGIKVSEMTSYVYIFRKELFLSRYKEYRKDILPTLLDLAFNKTTAIQSIETFLSFFIVVKIFDSDWPNIKKNFLNLIKKEKCNTTMEEFQYKLQKKMQKNNMNWKQGTAKTAKEIIGAQILSGIFLRDLMISEENQKIQESKMDNLKNLFFNEYKILTELILKAKNEKDLLVVLDDFPQKEVVNFLKKDLYLNDYMLSCFSLKKISDENARVCLNDFFKRAFANETIEEALINDEILKNYKKILEIYKEKWLAPYETAEPKDKGLNEIEKSINEMLKLSNPTNTTLKHISYINDLIKLGKYNLVLQNIYKLKKENFSSYQELNNYKSTSLIVKDFCTVENNQDQKEYCELILFEKNFKKLKENDSLNNIKLIFNYLVNERQKITFYENFFKSDFTDLIVEASKNLLLKQIDEYLFNSKPFLDYEYKVKRLLIFNKEYLDIYVNYILRLYEKDYRTNLNILDTNLIYPIFLEIYLKIVSINEKTNTYYENKLQPLYTDEAFHLAKQANLISVSASSRDIITADELKKFMNFLTEFKESKDEKTRLKFILENYKSKYTFNQRFIYSSFKLIDKTTNLFTKKLNIYLFKNSEYAFINETFLNIAKKDIKLSYYDIISKFYLNKYFTSSSLQKASFNKLLEPEEKKLLFTLLNNKYIKIRYNIFLREGLNKILKDEGDEEDIERAKIFANNLFQELVRIGDLENNLDLKVYLIKELLLIYESVDKYPAEVILFAGIKLSEL